MKRNKHPGKTVRTRSCRYLYQVSLMLIIGGIWLICYHTYHYTKSLTGPYHYAVEQALWDSIDTVTVGSVLPVPNHSSTGTSLRQALLNHTAQLLYIKRPDQGEYFGELSIPRLDLTLPIIEGTGPDELDLGVGHYIGSVLPGEKDNCILSGHRNTVFKDLSEVTKGDALFITTEAGNFKYIVDKIRIVDKDDRTVIVPRPRATLTISTCYPFLYAGPAPKRYVLVAHLTVE